MRGGPEAVGGIAVSRSTPFALLTLLVAGGLASGCVSTKDIEAIQSQLADIQRQVLQVQMQASSKTEVEGLSSSISRQTSTLLKSEADMQLKMEQLSAQLEELQARLEDTNNRLSNVSQQIATTNQELKAFRELPRFQPPVDPAAGVVDPNAPSPPPPTQATDPKALYEAAYSDYVRGSYDLAIRQFQEYLQTFPETDLSDNAAYWIGECYYRQRKFKQAISAFDRVLESYSTSDKVPSALLKKGYSHLELGEKAPGQAQLQKVIRDFPKSDEASLARQRLREAAG